MVGDLREADPAQQIAGALVRLALGYAAEVRARGHVVEH
jgi:hypothetical protein